MNWRHVSLGAIAAIGLAAGLTAPAAALDLPPAPTLTAPTLSTPSLSAPTPTLPAPTPTLPTTTVSTTVSTPAVPAPTPSLPAPSPTPLPTTSVSTTVSSPAPTPSAPAPSTATAPVSNNVSQATQTAQSTTTAASGTTTGAAGTATGAVGSAAGAAGGATGAAGYAAGSAVEPRTSAAAGRSAAAGGAPGGGTWASASAPLPVTRVPIASSSSAFAGRGAKRPARPRRIVIGFVSYRAGRLPLPVLQIYPNCRRAGLIRVNARAGVNLIRFNGRLGRKWLHDGTYVLVTPTMRIRFAVVAGRPTRKKTRLQPSVCREGEVAALAGEPVVLGSAAAGLADEEPVALGNEGIAETPPRVVLPTGIPGPSKVLGRTIDEVRDAVTGLHPAFYVVLAVAMAILAAATLPASAVPSPWLGAALARRRAALTLAGTTALVAVILAYLFAVGA